MEFLGLELQVPVKSWRDELYLRFALMVKQRAIELRLLIAMPWESAVGTWMRTTVGNISDGLLHDFRSARKAAVSAIEPLEKPNLKQIIEALEAQRDTLLALDRSFLIEMLWAKACLAEGAHAKLEAALAEIFISADRRRTPTEAAEALETLESEELYTLCPPSSRAMVVSCKGYVQQLQRGICPDGLSESDGFMARIIAKFWGVLSGLLGYPVLLHVLRTSL